MSNKLTSDGSIINSGRKKIVMEADIKGEVLKGVQQTLGEAVEL